MAPDVFPRPAAAAWPRFALLLLVLGAALQGCASRGAVPAAASKAAPAAAPASAAAVAPPPLNSGGLPPAAAPVNPAPARPVAAAVENAAPAPAVPTSVLAMLAYADRLRSLPGPELTQEISRLGDGGGSPPRQMQLALALLQTQQPADGQRAQSLLQRVLAANSPEVQPLHPLARQVASQHAAQRKLEEQLDRQAQLLRDQQRRIDQLSDRLDALRAIERSLPSRPTR